ncbi:MAG: hypothetical protein JWM45_61, partial [Pseudonocardiales bacterium]|nr:hypothetical protein [Pseudonocardiales bacterium]
GILVLLVIYQVMHLRRHPLEPVPAPVNRRTGRARATQRAQGRADPRTGWVTWHIGRAGRRLCRAAAHAAQLIHRT